MERVACVVAGTSFEISDWASSKLLRPLLREYLPDQGRSASHRTAWCGAEDLSRHFESPLTRLCKLTSSIPSPLVCGIDAKVADIFDFQKTSLSLQKETRAAQQDLLTTLITLSERAKAAGLQQPPTYHASITETATLSVNLTSTSPVMTRNKSSVRARRNGMAVSSASDLQLPPDRFAKYCMPWCSCDCHTPSSMSSYDALRDIFGCLSINHSGIPGLVKPCSEKKHCRRRMSPKLSVRYRLPRAIANFQFLMCSFSTLAGVELRVKLPRVVDWTSPVWQFATMGNFEAVANLFRNGLASPWDVSPVGGNLLHVSRQFEQVVLFR